MGFNDEGIEFTHVSCWFVCNKLEKAKKEAIQTAARVSDLVVNAVNEGVQEVYINEKRIEMEIRALTARIMLFKKQTDQWLTASHAINTAVKVYTLYTRFLNDKYTGF